jgi:hypothetical protein
MGRYTADTEQILGLVGRAKQIDMRTALSELESMARGAHDRYLANARHNSGMWP